MSLRSRNTLPLSAIPLGTIISCIELHPGRGANIARSAGAFAQLMARDGKYATVITFRRNPYDPCYLFSNHRGHL